MPRIQVTTNTETGDSFPLEICLHCAKKYPPDPQTCDNLLYDCATVAFNGKENGFKHFCCAKSMAKAMQTTEGYPGPVYEDATRDGDPLLCVLCDEPMWESDYAWPKPGPKKTKAIPDHVARLFK